MRDCKQRSGQRAYATGPAQRRGEGAGPAGSRGSLALSGGERREAEQAIGRHTNRDVVVPARLLKLFKAALGRLRMPAHSQLYQRLIASVGTRLAGLAGNLPVPQLPIVTEEALIQACEFSICPSPRPSAGRGDASAGTAAMRPGGARPGRARALPRCAQAPGRARPGWARARPVAGGR